MGDKAASLEKGKPTNIVCIRAELLGSQCDESGCKRKEEASETSISLEVLNGHQALV